MRDLFDRLGLRHPDHRHRSASGRESGHQERVGAGFDHRRAAVGQIGPDDPDRGRGVHAKRGVGGRGRDRRHRDRRTGALDDSAGTRPSGGPRDRPQPVCRARPQRGAGDAGDGERDVRRRRRGATLDRSSRLSGLRSCRSSHSTRRPLARPPPACPKHAARHRPTWPTSWPSRRPGIRTRRRPLSRRFVATSVSSPTNRPSASCSRAASPTSARSPRS